MLIIAVNASAIKISYSDFDRKIYFKPNLQKELTFTVSEAEKVAEVYLRLKGDFAKYATVTPDKVYMSPGEQREIKVMLSLPEQIPEGIHTLEVSATEVPANKQKGAFVLMPGVGITIKIINTDVQYNSNIGSFNTVMTGNSITAYLNIVNNGNKNMAASADFALYDAEGQQVIAWKKENIGVPSFESKSIKETKKLSNAIPGYYTLKVNVKCPDRTFNLEKEILNHAKELEVYDFKAYKRDGKLNVEFDVENKFLAPISAYAMLGFYEGEKDVAHYSIPSREIPPMTRKKMSLRKLLQGMRTPAGTYTLKGILSYEGKRETYETIITLTEEDLAKVQEDGGGFQFNAPDIAKKPKTETEESSGFSVSGKMLIRVLAGIIIVIVLIIIIRKVFHKKEY